MFHLLWQLCPLRHLLVGFTSVIKERGDHVQDYWLLLHYLLSLLLLVETSTHLQSFDSMRNAHMFVFLTADEEHSFINVP